MSSGDAQPKVLIVDDNKENLDLVTYFLKPQRYTLLTAADGESALEIVTRDKPDIILLDIMLPKMSGFEVCEKIKKNPETRFIPVVMITALKELKDKIRALEAGADDFISKPFENVELLTRVKSLLRIKKYHDELEESNKALQRMNRFKEDLSHLLVHDMKNPLFVIQGNLQMMGMGLNDAMGAGVKKYVDRIDRSAKTLLRMVTNLVDISDIEDGTFKLNPTMVNLNKLIEQVVEVFRDYPEHAQKNIHLHPDEELPFVKADNAVIERVLDNLINFALTNVPPDGTITVSTEQDDSAVRVIIFEEGLKIPEKYKDQIFEKFSQVEIKNNGYRLGRGLGFSFCKMAMESHNGQVQLDTSNEKGNRFILTFPKN